MMANTLLASAARAGATAAQGPISGGSMPDEELAHGVLAGRISRRTLIRQLVAGALTIAGASAFAEGLATMAAAAEQLEPGATKRPGVTTVAPASGPTGGGTKVTVTGKKISGASAVHFGSKKATID